tara:strand:+ start:70 stop:345 length:276 start_codon:yes stop_codon:yes gene_type:complete
MPTYTFKSNKTGKEWDDTIKIAELEGYYKEHDCEQIFTTMPEVVSTTGDVHSKTTHEFQDRMKDIHKTAGRKSQMFKGPRDRNMIYHNIKK